MWVGRVGAKWETGSAAAAEGRPWRLLLRSVVGGKLRGKSDCELDALTCHPSQSIIANIKKYVPPTPRKAHPMPTATFLFVPHPPPLELYDEDVLNSRDRATSNIYE